MQITYYGHSCFGVALNSTHLLFDPFISGNPAAAHIKIDAIPADYILISHGHQDHILDVEVIAKRTDAKIISNHEIVTHYKNKGLENGHGMNHGGCYSFDFGTVQYVNAVHSSSFPDGTYAGNPGGFVVQDKTSKKVIYYAGDTALTYDMRLIAEDYDITCALLPIGDNYTMGVKDAVRCAEFVGTNTVIGLHYNTFPPITIDTAAAVKKFAEVGRTLLLPKIGYTISL